MSGYGSDSLLNIDKDVEQCLHRVEEYGVRALLLMVLEHHELVGEGFRRLRP
jgi:hypothetical protein